MSEEQEGFSFDEEIPHKKFADDPTPPAMRSCLTPEYKEAQKKMNHHLSGIAETAAHTLYRKDDPDTSREAAEGINVTNLEQEVYNAVCSFRDQPIIGEDVRPRLPDVHFNSITPRFKALEKKGLITYTGEKRPGESGRNQRVLIATKYWKGETE